MTMKLYFLLGIVFFASELFGQNTIIIHGIILDLQNNEPVELVTIHSKEYSIETRSSEDGVYELIIPSGKASLVQFRRTRYKPFDYHLPVLKEGTRFEINIKLVPVESNLEVIVTADRVEDAGMVREKVDAMKLLPSTTGNLESILPNINLISVPRLKAWNRRMPRVSP